PKEGRMAEGRRAGGGRWRWLAWWLALGVWTFGLLYPFSHDKPKTFSREMDFSISKTLHVSAYAFLAGTLVLLPLRPGRRWGFVGLLALPAVLSEVLQYSFPALGRPGRVDDVALDWLGIGLGLALTRRWWRRPPPPSPPPPESA